MYLGHNAGVVQQEDGSVYLSPPRVVSDEKGMVSVIDGGIGEVPGSACVERFDIYGGDKICPPEDHGFGGFGCCGQPLRWF